MTLEPKICNLKIAAHADSGYRSTESHRVSLDQYEAVLRILNGRPTPDEAKLKERLDAATDLLHRLADENPMVNMPKDLIAEVYKFLG